MLPPLAIGKRGDLRGLDLAASTPEHVGRADRETGLFQMAVDGRFVRKHAITVGAVAGYMTGIGAALGDAVFGAVAAFGLSFVQQFVIEREAWLLHMRAAIDEVAIPEPARRMMLEYFDQAAAFLVNRE